MTPNARPKPSRLWIHTVDSHRGLTPWTRAADPHCGPNASTHGVETHSGLNLWIHPQQPHSGSNPWTHTVIPHVELSCEPTPQNNTMDPSRGPELCTQLCTQRGTNTRNSHQDKADIRWCTIGQTFRRRFRRMPDHVPIFLKSHSNWRPEASAN